MARRDGGTFAIPEPYCMVRGDEKPGFFRRLAEHSDDAANWP